jgi:sec-independent protein translocase protein TatA
MAGIGWQELLLVLLVVLLLFGAKRLPELSRSFGKSIREFKHGMKDGAQEPDANAVKKADGKPPEQESGDKA